MTKSSLKVLFAQRLGVPGLEEDPLRALRERDVVLQSRGLHDDRRPDENFEGERLRSGCAGDEVHRRVDVGAGVEPEIEPRDVGGCALGDGLRQREGNFGITGIDRHVRLDRNGHVDDAHGERIRPP